MPNDRLDFSDGAILTVLDSPADPERDLLLMEFEVPSGAMPTAPHVHPRQVETYAVQGGSIEVLIGRTWSSLKAGESATVPAGTPHAFRNRSGKTARFLNEHAPALRFEGYIRTVHSLAEAGELKGGADLKTILYACVLMKEYSDTKRAPSVT